MTSSNTSKTPNLPKLLRTLIEYQADTLLIPTHFAPRIWYKKNWKIIEEHPELTWEDLEVHLKNVLGESFLEALNNGLEQRYPYKSAEFLLHLQENMGGPVFVAHHLKPIPPEKDWPLQAHEWIKNGGVLVVHDDALYASLLKGISQKNENTIVSLERVIQYPLPSFLGLIHQKEWGEHFLDLEDGLRQASELHAETLGLNGIELPKELRNEVKRIVIKN